MYIQITILMIIIIKTKCSVVIDDFSQKDVPISEYCPEIGVCKDGSHVMCTHYDPNHKMGPMCTGVENVSMNEEYAALLLDLVNTIRSRAARGLAMGYDKELLPRAYGMYRVQWDSELGTLAQLWANQCIIQFDNCRATKKFPDPGQLASITRFVTSSWIPLSKQNITLFVNSPGFKKDKILYALKASMRSWFSTNEEIDSEIITDRNSSWSDELIKNPYLQIVDGSVTHMGCGTSAFKEYRYYTETTHLIYNVVRLVCNFSSRVRDRRGIYNTEPPTTPEYTARCGCPPGYDEDSGCLCYESRKNQTKPCKNTSKPGKLQVVVLPIITVEDYPKAKEDLRIRTNKQRALNKIQNRSPITENRRYQPNRHFQKSLTTTPIFKLPSRKLKEDIQLDKIKKDVAPRKDFSKSKNLLSNYLSKRRTFDLQNKVLNFRQDKSVRRSLPIKPIKSLKDNYIKRKTYNNWKDDVAQRKNISSDIKLSKQGDTRLLSLLNKLENEANYIKVNTNDRSVLNKSIREIYSALKNSHSINKNRNIIPNKKITDQKEVTPFIENNKLIIYEDLFKNISSSQRYLKPRNISIFSTKHQNNTHLRNALSGKKFGRYSYRYTETPQTKDIYNNEYLRSYIKSDEEFLPENKRIYYQNRINSIKRKLKANYVEHVKSGSGLQFRPTLEASHLQFRQTLPKI